LRKVNAEIWEKPTDPFYGAPVIIIVLADKSKKTYINDGSLVLGNMMLAAHELGLASCWINRAKETFQRPEWQEWLTSIGVDAGRYEGIGHLALGYADGPLPPPLPRKPDRVVWVE
jgi:nitroreductase